MQSMFARDAENGFGLLLNIARAEPVANEKHSRPFAVVNSVEEYDRLLSLTEQSGKARSTRSASVRTNS
ncbi:MAG: type II toxin-antitoxin system Phd/YefM family antitoxin [Mesorhizobium sp.]|nr:MAG: type II toxin-antitoxin system Phd/YefM family antitoxin [Mesorhizobium sp.]